MPLPSTFTNAKRSKSTIAYSTFLAQDQAVKKNNVFPLRGLFSNQFQPTSSALTALQSVHLHSSKLFSLYKPGHGASYLSKPIGASYAFPCIEKLDFLGASTPHLAQSHFQGSGYLELKAV